MASPFLTHNPTAEADSLAILHLRRDLQIPTVLKSHDDENEGYDEGKVTNTRYGSFPHSTLIGNPWGSQIVASKVDTGSRGRRTKQPQGANNRKRKSDELETSDLNTGDRPAQKAAVAADSGFAHLLRPTPELWTAGLPHRTQVVYTPDYSYILHRMRVRPGSTIVEAGAGSGSFTHAAARAVFNGYPTNEQPSSKRRRVGKVCSFEFHEQRAQKIREEVRTHGLEEIVRVNHKDVCTGGFLLGDSTAVESPKANAVFLDLPAPWLALDHLVREPGDGSISPLDPSSPVHLCSFSPCLEQAQRTISALRQHSWLFISMVEVAHRQIEVRRVRYADEGDGGRPIQGPRNVEEATSKLRTYEKRARTFQVNRDSAGADDVMQRDDEYAESKDANVTKPEETQTHSSRSENAAPAYKQGTLIHRSTGELKTHTSYLVFAILPCSWSEDDELRCRKEWPSHAESERVVGKSKNQMKREAKEQQKLEKQAASTSRSAAAVE